MQFSERRSTWRQRWPIVAMLALLAGTSSAIAQSPAAPAVVERVPPEQRFRYRLLGVFDAVSGEPVDAVDVFDVLGGSKTQTGPSGTISLFFLPEGASLIRLRKIGYETITMPVLIAPTDTGPITIVLRRVTELPAVVVKESAPVPTRLRAFEDRRAHAVSGHFISTSELRENDNRGLADVIISKIPGVTTTIPNPPTSNETGMERYLISGRKNCPGRVLNTECKRPSCYPRVFVDAIRFSGLAADGGAQPIDFDKLSTVDYAGVEFYASGSTAPPEYSAPADECGILILWTRSN